MSSIWWSSLNQQTTRAECIFTLNLRLGSNPALAGSAAPRDQPLERGKSCRAWLWKNSLWIKQNEKALSALWISVTGRKA